jgi:hypothetical protein
MSDTSPPPKEGFFRRNGKPQSCEPCRKSKVRCDHTYPTCNRCKSRNAGARCVYHPAPLTRPRSQYRRWRSDGANSSTSSVPSAAPDAVFDVDLEGSNGHGTTPGSNPSLTTASSGGGDYQSYRIDESRENDYETASPSLIQPRHSVHSNKVTSPSRPNGSSAFLPNFLGSTSYSSVFAHSWKNGAAGSAKQWQTPLGDMVHAEDAAADITSVNIGAQLLQLLSTVPHIEQSIKRFYQVREFVFIPESLVVSSVVSIKATLQGQSTSSSYLQNLSKAVFINTSRELDFSSNRNPKTIPELLTGPNLRWEIIGIIFTLLALSSQSHADAGGPRGQQASVRDRQEFTNKMAKASELCLAFCDNNEHVNDLVAWYQYESLLLQTSLHGDTSKFCRPHYSPCFLLSTFM